jgi:hypothetical protein
MRRTRFLLSTASLLTGFGGALLLGTPRPSAAAVSGRCTTEQTEEAVADLRKICGGDNGEGRIFCYADGAWEWLDLMCYDGM